ncbi:hypothetical protein [Deinococcus cellulosilyticus]|uniref:Uncharacterized protein n=1 Tax=Deinococcus cellulosilyticus (strain DSM 18568 / NBRC 106333 / KACC 11606 / 5516J-15) TaxID=1223518 RepID=A0A511N9H4_DEIC1|nr:hypothetical protein [Deinococcus cellulosilyticus]GEM49483.1 hypothetical protein DC3_51180 [Deinococcus cellulosilyticus NBRC 106333 = KACC 11606]
MKAYKGVVVDGVVVLEGVKLPDGTVVTVTVGEAELLRATISNALRIRRNKRAKVRIKTQPIYAEKLSLD